MPLRRCRRKAEIEWPFLTQICPGTLRTPCTRKNLYPPKPAHTHG